MNFKINLLFQQLFLFDTEQVINDKACAWLIKIIQSYLSIHAGLATLHDISA